MDALGICHWLHAEHGGVRRMELAARHASGRSGHRRHPSTLGGTMTRRLRSVIDLRDLPEVVFGPRDLMWWGTLGFVLIEGFTLVLCAAVYVYLQQNFSTWPPQHTPLPSLGAPTLQVIVMLASLPVVLWTTKAARRFDLD